MPASTSLFHFHLTGGADVLIVNIDGSDQYYHCKYRQQCMCPYIISQSNVYT